jgi:large subunit ribosomal protein L2
MGIKIFKPRSPGRRAMTGFDFAEITKDTPEKALTSWLHSKAGRSNHGIKSIRYKGGGHKRLYREIDFKRDKLDVPGTVFSIEYDPNRTCRIALLHYADGEKRYILAPIGLNVGDKVLSGDKADIKPGNNLPVSLIPAGTIVHNVEMRPGKGGQMARGAGAEATLVSKLGRYCQIKLPSGEVRNVLSNCRASIGQVGNTDNENISLGKAGRARWRGIRPSVRGQAMNPIDHPLGGGEGVGKGHHPVTPWGVNCKGLKTRHNKRTDSMIVKRRAKRKQRK